MKVSVSLVVPGLLLAAAAGAHAENQDAQASPLPDLVAQVAEPMQRSFVVRNQGQATAVGSEVLVGCKPRTLPSAPPNKDCSLGAEYSNFDEAEVNTVARLALPSLAAGESVTLEVPYWRGLALNEDQPYHFKINVDPDNVVEEADEDNNVSRSYRLSTPVDYR